jgi:hypothetical protein
MYWSMYSERVGQFQLLAKLGSLCAISSFFPFRMLAESSEISSRTAFQAAPYGVSSLTKSSDSDEKLPTNSCEEPKKKNAD